MEYNNRIERYAERTQYESSNRGERTYEAKTIYSRREGKRSGCC